MGGLKVGPQSAGAEPGPICYGQGGDEPSITDANLLLGRLSPDDFLGGEIPLDLVKAREGISKKISARIGVSDIEAALSIIKIAVMNMSLAVRGISIERGYDPRDFVMLAFGGAGPLHAVEVARELHIPTVIVPNYPGQFSALGMLMADIQHDFVRTYYGNLEGADFGTLQEICDELILIGWETLDSEAVSEEATVFQRYLDIRYSGQEFYVSVPIAAEYIQEADAEAIRKAFNELHERRYGYHTPDQAVELVNVRIKAIGKRQQMEFPTLNSAAKENGMWGKRMVYFEDPDRALECPVYGRENLQPNSRLTGPAIIKEYACTTVLFPGDGAVVAKTGELVITIRGDES
jgi:N-methylhydantoinase A